VVAALGAGCGEKEEPDVASLPPEPAATPESPKPAAPGGTEEAGGKPGGGGGKGTSASSPRREATQAVEAYIEWIDARRGGPLCTLLTGEAIDALELPVRRSSCAASLSASIGHRDPRGAPVFEGVRLRATHANVRDTRARIRAAVSITFADRGRASVEDDLIYLRRVGGEWRVAKPSVTLYRAIGTEPPLKAITPP
jgi:hypothetical protein